MQKTWISDIKHIHSAEQKPKAQNHTLTPSIGHKIKGRRGGFSETQDTGELRPICFPLKRWPSSVKLRPITGNWLKLSQKASKYWIKSTKRGAAGFAKSFPCLTPSLWKTFLISHPVYLVSAAAADFCYSFSSIHIFSHWSYSYTVIKPPLFLLIGRTSDLSDKTIHNHHFIPSIDWKLNRLDR